MNQRRQIQYNTHNVFPSRIDSSPDQLVALNLNQKLKKKKKIKEKRKKKINNRKELVKSKLLTD